MTSVFILASCGRMAGDVKGEKTSAGETCVPWAAFLSEPTWGESRAESGVMAGDTSGVNAN